MRIGLAALLVVALGCAPTGPVTGDEDAGHVIDAGHGGDAGEGSDAGGSDDAGHFPVDGGAQDGDGGANPPSDAGFFDGDGDGLDDAWELDVASRALPAFSFHSQERCPLGGIVFRLRPHPGDPDGGLLAVTYTYLYERDCGLTSHLGDNEAFGATIDPARPTERMVTALRAVAHQKTICQRTSNCGTCAGMTDCERVDGGAPILFVSRDKHAGYVSLSACGTLTCLDACELTAPRQGVPLVNAGEPNAPLTRDLTDAGFITAANGWTDQRVFHFDPWGAADFGAAGNVKDDLEDVAFLTPACR